MIDGYNCKSWIELHAHIQRGEGLQTFTKLFISEHTEQTELTQADQPGALLAVVEVIASGWFHHCVEANTCSCAACTLGGAGAA